MAPVGAAYDVIHNDADQARIAFQRLKGGAFKGEAAIIGFLEAAHGTITVFGKARLVEAYVSCVGRFLSRYNLRYRIVPPFRLRLLLSGTFAGLYVIASI